jgi:tetratricopeptide (TPR) repeat protein
MMTRLLAVAVLSLGAGFAWAADTGQAPQGELVPLPAVVAEQRVADARDAIADALWLKTEEQWHKGEWDEAIRVCHQLVQLEPHFIEAYNGAAWMLWSMDRDDESIALYREGIAANPKRYEIHHDFGMYYWHRQTWGKAVEQFRRSVENGAPRNFQHMLPNSLERARRKQEALVEWRALLNRFPDDPIAERHIDALEKDLED